MMATNSNVDQSTEQSPGLLISTLQSIIPLIAIFTGFSYLLGRLYKEAYYKEFGLPDTLLHFNNADYLFDSFEMLVLSGVYVTTLGFAVRFRFISWFVAQVRGLFSFDIDLRGTFSALGMIFGLPFYAVSTLFFLPSWSDAPGLWGLLAGLSLGAWGLLVVGVFPIGFGVLLRMLLLVRQIRLSIHIRRKGRRDLGRAMARATGRRLGGQVINYGRYKKVQSAKGWQWMMRPSWSYFFVAVLALAAIALSPVISQRLAKLDSAADLENRIPVSRLVVNASGLLGEPDPGLAAWERSRRYRLDSAISSVDATNADVLVVLSNTDALYVTLSRDVVYRKETDSKIHVELTDLKLQLETGPRKIKEQTELKLADLEQDHESFHELVNKNPLRVHRIPKGNIRSLTHEVQYLLIQD